MSAEDEALLDRPFCFIVVLWGERFRDYFLEYCVPSLLAPGNLPSLRTRQPSKFLIATQPEDWAAMAATPIFRLLERYVTPVYIEIPPCPPDKSGCEHMGIGHKRACEMAFRDKAYATVVTPDSVLSDGSVARLQEHARAGVELVLSAATLRIAEEGFLASLDKLSAVGAQNRRDTGTPLVITGGQMTSAALASLHSQALAYEWDAPHYPPPYPDVPAAAWWRVPGEDGIVLHCLAWAPLLIDYNAVREHDTSSLDNWTLDGDYVFKNLGVTKAIHVATDSDEMFLASWSPLSDRPADLDRGTFFGALGKGAMFRLAFLSPIFDPLKRQLFFVRVRWHAHPVTARWAEVEARSLRTIRTYVRPPNERPSPVVWAVWGAVLRSIAILETLRRLPKVLQLWRSLNGRRLALVFRGDVKALGWLWWTMRKFAAGLFGRPFDIPKPHVPGAEMR